MNDERLSLQREAVSWNGTQAALAVSEFDTALLIDLKPVEPDALPLRPQWLNIRRKMRRLQRGPDDGDLARRKAVT